jgi:hypothetical protein
LFGDTVKLAVTLLVTVIESDDDADWPASSVTVTVATYAPGREYVLVVDGDVVVVDVPSPKLHA